MLFRSLPPEIVQLLTIYHAPPRLVAHLTVVHDTAHALIALLDMRWPRLVFDRPAVLIGAATHDIGKVLYPGELNGSGNLHEEIGPHLLLENGLPEAHARFARTHGRWQEEVPLHIEDLLVAFADTIWKGKRDQTLEEALIQLIAQECHEDYWNVYTKFDELSNELAGDAHVRILWQGTYSL